MSDYYSYLFRNMLNRNPYLLKIEYARSSRSQCRSIFCSKIDEDDLRIGVVNDTWPWTEWYHFDCFWDDRFEDFFEEFREKVEDVDIEDLMEGYSLLSGEDQEKAEYSLREWIDNCINGGDEDEDEDDDDLSFLTPEVRPQNETLGNDGNDKKKEHLRKDQNGNKTSGNNGIGNDKKKEHLPKDQNGNKTSGNNGIGNDKKKEHLQKDQNGNKTSGNNGIGNDKKKEHLPKDQNGNKTSGNNGIGNDKKKEHLPKDQNGNKTSGNDGIGNDKKKEHLPKDQNGNKTSANDGIGNDKKKEHFPKDQNGNKTSEKDEKKMVEVTKGVAVTKKKGLKREIGSRSEVLKKKIRT